mmetsp:Transcript_14308/g.16528  ORF Transcript_14308/g.16528 Transcript_14308/m.16528 type:complete len:85 (+) Transcript_14308:727-981(+)
MSDSDINDIDDNYQVQPNRYQINHQTISEFRLVTDSKFNDLEFTSSIRKEYDQKNMFNYPNYPYRIGTKPLRIIERNSLKKYLK